MPQNLRVLFFALLLLPLTVLGEGSKQLTPNTTGTASYALTDPRNTRAGYLAHDANFPTATGVAITSLSFLKPSGFSRNGATYSRDHRLYIRVKAGERLFYGVHRAIHDQTQANQANLILTVRRTNAATGVDDGTFVQANTLLANTSSTRDMLLVANQNGVINTAAEAEAGPNRSINGKSVNTGYRPLSIYNDTNVDYDYYVEFTQEGETGWTDDGRRFSVYDFWDFTVIDANGDERQGRMRSKLWSFSSGGTTNVFASTFNMFPLVPSDDETDRYFVKKFELAGIAPQNFFRFVTNSAGSIPATGRTTPEQLRRSQTSQTDYAEFFNFVNNPDPLIWPSATAPTFAVGITSSCNPATGGGGKATFFINSSVKSTFIVYIDLNGVAGYQAGTRDVLLEQSGLAGARTLDWNGRDGLNAVVPSGTNISYQFKNGSSPVHFPVWDAEWNDGFRVEDVRPLAGSNYNGLLFWDDSNIATSSTTDFPVPRELFGVNSSTGVHKWGSSTSAAGDTKTMNTWTYGYTNSLTETSTFTYGNCSSSVDVGVTKTASGPFAVGVPFNFTITAKNNNANVVANGVKVIDQLDTEKFEFVSASSTNFNASTGVWDVGNIAATGSATLTLTVKPLAVGSASNVINKTQFSPDPTAANNTATATVTVVAAADIEVKNTVAQTTYNNGDIVTYTVTATNLGPNNATGVTVTDKLPTGLTLQGTAPAGYNATSGLWTVGALAVGETKTLTLNAKVSTTGTISTIATKTGGTQFDNVSGNNSQTATITVNPTADIAVTNTVATGPYYVGQPVTYTVTARNIGPNDATSATITDLLPAGMTFASATASAGTYNASTGAWILPIANGITQTLTIVAVPTAVGTYATTAARTAGNENDGVSTNNSASNSITVGASADVAVTNVVSSGPYVNGQDVTYTVTATNNGPSDATGVVITDRLPTGLTFVSATPTVGTYVSSNGLWTIGALPAGTTQTLTLVAKPTTTGSITTTATKTAQTEFDPVTANNARPAVIEVEAAADIAITNVVSAGPYYNGVNETYTVTIRNNGPNTATGVVIGAQIPASLTVVSFTAPEGTTVDNVARTWSIPNLASGATAVITVVAAPNTTGAISTTATLVSINETDLVSSNNVSSTSITVLPQSDIAVTNTVAAGPYLQGEEVTYTVTASNNGPDNATNVLIRDLLSTTNFTFVSATTSTGTYTSATGNWDIASLPKGATETLTLVVKPRVSGSVSTTASRISADQFDGNGANNIASNTITVEATADIAVTNTVSAGPYYNGKTLTYTVVARNNGPGATSNVSVQDQLPADLTLVSATPTLGSYDAATGLWTVGNLASGAAQTLTLVVIPTTTGSFTTTATKISSSEIDNNVANNTAANTITVGAASDLAITNVVSEGPYFSGTNVTYTVTVTNLGPDGATGVSVTDRLPSGLTFVSASPSVGSYVASTGLWTIGNLDSGDSETLTLVARPTNTNVLTTTATVRLDQYDKNTSNNSEANAISAGAPLQADLSVTNTVSAGPYYVGKDVTYTVSIRNNGPNASSGVVAVDDLPEGLTFISATPSVGNFDASTGIWEVGSIAVNATRTLTLVARPTEVGTYTTTASKIASNEIDNVTTNDAASNSITVNAAADIAVTKSISAGPYNATDEVTFTTTVTNNGPNAATSLVVRDLYSSSAGFIYVSANPSQGTYANASGDWAIGELAVGESVTLTVIAKPNRAGTLIQSASRLSSAEVDLIAGNNTAGVLLEVNPTVDIAVTNTVTTAAKYNGVPFTYTVNVRNYGPSPATEVSIEDLLPAGLTYVSSTTTQGEYNPVTGIWSVGSLAAGTSSSLIRTLTITVLPTMAGDIITTASKVAGAEYESVLANNDAINTVTILPSVDIAVSNSFAEGPYYIGKDIIYTVTAKNEGPNNATGVKILDRFISSSGFTFVSASAPDGTTYTSNDGIWTIGDLAANETKELTMVVRPNRTGSLTSTTTRNASNEVDQVTSNNTFTTSIEVSPSVDIAVTNTIPAGTYYNGDNVTFTVNARNNGPVGATDINIETGLPTGFSLVSATPGMGTFDSETGIWTINTLGVNTTTALTLIGKATAAGNYTLTSTRTTTTEVDVNAANDSDTENVLINGKAEITVDMTVKSNTGTEYYRNASIATFTVTVTNTGPDAATDLTFKDSRTGFITFTGVQADPGVQYDHTTGEGFIARLEPGESKQLVVMGYPNVTGSITLSATKLTQKASTVDILTANNTAFATIFVSPSADLQVTNTVADGPYYAGINTTFTVSVKNNSTVDAATGVQVANLLPEGLQLVTATAGNGIYNETTGIWSLASDLAAGSTQILTLVVKPVTTGVLTTTANIVTPANQYDNVTANNSESRSITVLPMADVSIAAAFVGGPHSLNQTVSFVVTATNNSAIAAEGVSVMVPVPSSLEYQNATPSVGTYDFNTGIWTIGTLAGNQTAALEFSLVAKEVGNTLVTASISTITFDAFEENNAATAFITVIDNPAFYTIAVAQHFYNYRNADEMATVTDPDGAIVSATLTDGTLPAGTRLTAQGTIVVEDFRLLRPGVYNLTISTTDINGNVTENQLVALNILGDWDGDGISYLEDIDDNNDGITDVISGAGVDPFGTTDGSPFLNYTNPSFVHPVYGAFRDKNEDGINDWFDLDLDGIINSLDLDMDGDGIANVTEANGGVSPSNDIYNALTATMRGIINAQGMPLSALSVSGEASIFSMPDTDQDGRKDFLDLDADNDGIKDLIEAQTASVGKTGYRAPSGFDVNRNGIDDAFDATQGGGFTLEPVNRDAEFALSDAIPDYLDLDTDNDFGQDYFEGHDFNFNGRAIDDLILAGSIYNTQAGNGFNLYGNTDANRNGIPDWLDNSNRGIPNFLDSNTTFYLDTDQDGLVNLFDADNFGVETVPAQPEGALLPLFRDNAVSTPLPVTMISFTGKLQTNGVLLNWKTASEKDNDFFEVERSTDGKNFQMIGKVKGNGTTTIEMDYSFLDAASVNGTVYYRLRQVDFDGKFEYTKIISVKSKAVAIQVEAKVYPNPATDVLNLTITGTTGKATVQIYGADGKLASTQEVEISTGQVLDISTLPVGMYILKVKGEQFEKTLRFIKQ
ncbi:T9SS type A sorting domain-containing protein [Rufibacter sp. LB8]|uniref:T9SS type A sorting domain-containing protein n=1 Tax=Rufibacter sp. LB8 TaxID=2777781 RepID=UPI00178C610A|nr:T9SS type A sorting domain-containing protein [Rufibacter sp. LB8]